MRLDRWGLLGDTATLLTGKSEISPIAVAFSLLALTGAELSDRVVESGRIDRSQLNLFILLVGQSGITRKSSAMSRAGSFWREMLETSTRVHEGAGSGEGLARLLGGGTKLLPARGCLLYDESIQFMSKAAIDGSSLLSVFNSLYDGRSWENQIKRSEHSSRIDNGVLSFIGAATPEIYQSLWSETGVGIGLLNRFLLIELQPPAERYFFPIFPSNDEKLTVAQRWHDRLADPAHCISWPSQASAQCQAWYTSLAPRAEITRIDELLRRLVFLNCWFRNITEVDALAIEEATAIANNQIEVRSRFWPETNPMSQRIEDALREGKGSLSNRDLYRKLNAQRCMDQFTRALDGLERSGIITKSSIEYPDHTIGHRWIVR